MWWVARWLLRGVARIVVRLRWLLGVARIAGLRLIAAQWRLVQRLLIRLL